MPFDSFNLKFRVKVGFKLLKYANLEVYILLVREVQLLRGKKWKENENKTF